MRRFLAQLEIWIEERSTREKALLFCLCFFSFIMLPLWGLLPKVESYFYYQKAQSKELKDYLSALQKEFLKVSGENNIHELEKTIMELEETLLTQEEQKSILQTNSSVIVQLKLLSQEFALEKFVLAQDEQIFLEGSGSFKNVFGFLLRVENFFKALKVIDFSIYPNAENLDFVLRMKFMDFTEDF